MGGDLMIGAAGRTARGRAEAGQKRPRAAAPGHDILEGTDVFMGQRRDDVRSRAWELT
jgi:hypothetical protein